MIDAASLLGTRWIRFTLRATNAKNPVAHRELADYARARGIQLLVENGSRTKDVNSVAAAVKAIGRNVAPCPDTGNWADDVRMAGLKRTGPVDHRTHEINDRRLRRRNHLHSQSSTAVAERGTVRVDGEVEMCILIDVIGPCSSTCVGCCQKVLRRSAAPRNDRRRGFGNDRLKTRAEGCGSVLVSMHAEGWTMKP